MVFSALKRNADPIASEAHSNEPRRSFFQALKTQLTGKVVIVVAVCLPSPQDQPVYEPVPKEQASRRVEEKPDTEHAIPFSKPERGANRPQNINVHRGHEQARKKMRQDASGKLFDGNRD